MVAKRPQLIELAVRLDATMEIPDGGDTSICDMLSNAIPLIIPVKASKTLLVCTWWIYLGRPFSCVEEGYPLPK